MGLFGKKKDEYSYALYSEGDGNTVMSALCDRCKQWHYLPKKEWVMVTDSKNRCVCCCEKSVSEDYGFLKAFYQAHKNR